MATVTDLDFARVLPYLPEMNEGSLDFAEAHGTPPEDVALLAAICLRETGAGYGSGYSPRGSPDGAGDWMARRGHWTERTGVLVLEDAEDVRAAGFGLPRGDDGRVLPGPYAIPQDRRGFGRGLFQADVLGDHADMIPPPPWPVSGQAAVACSQLQLARRQLAAYADHPLFARAIVARYNAPLHAVVAGLEAGDPDIATTRPPYGKDVLARRDALRSTHPRVFGAFAPSKLPSPEAEVPT